MRTSLNEQGERLRGDGATVINMAVDGKLAGLFAIADPVKASTPDCAEGAGGRRHQGHHAHGRQQDHGECRRAQPWHHRRRSGSAARSEERGGRKTAEGRTDRRDGRRRRQRRAGARRRRSRHRHGNRHRCRDGERRHHAVEGRSRRHRPCPPALAGDHAQYPAEPVLRLHLQRRRHPDRRGHSLSGVRPACCRRSSPPRRWRCRP